MDYPLTTLLDPFGNKITFAYTYVNYHYLVTKITYGGSSNATIEFQYQLGRPDTTFSYNAGLKVSETRLLEKIHCKYLKDTLRTYGFTYQYKKNVSQLSRVDCMAHGDSINPLRFYYGENRTASSFTTTTTTLSRYLGVPDFSTFTSSLRTYKGKFDYKTENDGLIFVRNKFPYVIIYNDRADCNAFYNEYEVEDTIFIYTQLEGGIRMRPVELKTEHCFVDIICANIDGKGKDEVIKINDSIVTGITPQVSLAVFDVYEVKENGGVNKKYTRYFGTQALKIPNLRSRVDHPRYHFSGDFNGDGKAEIFTISCQHPLGMTEYTSMCYLFDLEENKMLYSAHVFPYSVEFLGVNQTDPQAAFYNTDRLFVIDYDGDGKSDICLINDEGTHIYSFVVNNGVYNMEKIATYTSLKKDGLKNRKLLIGEFNGDGKADLLLSPQMGLSTDKTWSVFYAKGNGQYEKKTFIGITVSNNANHEIFLQDVNGDGLTDLIKYTNTSTYTYLAANGILSTTPISTPSNPNTIIIPTDINTSNYSYQLLTLMNDTVRKLSFSRNDTKEMLLTGVVNSLGVVDKNYYHRLDENNTFYTINNETAYNTIFPYDKLRGPIYIPVCTEQYFKGQKKETVHYNYENAIIHKQGLGFRGFEKVITQDKMRNRYNYRLYNPYEFGVLIKEISPFRENGYNYSIDISPNRIAKINIFESYSYDFLKDVGSTSSYEHDSYGNMTSQIIDCWDGEIRTSLSNEYYNNRTDTTQMLGLLKNTTRTNYRNMASFSEQMNILAYNNDVPVWTEKYINNGLASNELDSCDVKGNIVQKKVYNYASPNALTTKYTYDTYGRLTKEIDPLGFNTSYVYNANGNLSTRKNHKSQQTNYTYDAFGRTLIATFPDGVADTTSLSWIAGGTNGIYCVINTSTNKPTTKIYYDALNRETRSSQTRFNGTEMKVDKLYDSFGRLQKTSLPFTTSSALLWNECGYDEFDRPLFVQEASGRSTTYDYDPLNARMLTTTKDGISSTQIFDELGNPAKVVDTGGTITYTYRPDGQLGKVTAPGNVVTSFGYDVYGRRTSISDPHSGNQTFEYDTAGNLYKETDANGFATTHTYDSYNRLTGKSNSTIKATYMYNTDGLLFSASSTNGTSTVYTYDTYGKLSTEKETVMGGVWLQKSYYYGVGQLDSLRYQTSSGLITTESYLYANNYRSEIKLDGNSIWKLSAENAFGLPTSAVTGKLTRTYGYDVYGYPTYRRTRLSSTNNVAYQTYAFDPQTGNLMWRKDSIRNKSENFVYDNLNRLTKYEGQTVDYNYQGNITKKSDAGDFHYFQTTKPYQPSAFVQTSAIGQDASRRVAFNALKRPYTINDYECIFSYNEAGERVKMDSYTTNAKRYYLSGCYEIDEKISGKKEKLYLGGDYYTAPAVYVKQDNGAWAIHFIIRDYLGSITHVTNSNGTLVQELSYDTWGNLRNPVSHVVWDTYSTQELFLGRGYTGHEHLTQFRLINMNARLYDPVAGRFLSPDPYVQNMGFSQNFNRYAYCINNPLIYTDEDGELFGWIFGAVGGFFKGVARFASGKGKVTDIFTYTWKGAVNGAKVDLGWYQGNSYQIMSRFTKELPQTLLGYFWSNHRLLWGNVDEVKYYKGATYVINGDSKKNNGVTLGSFINMNTKNTYSKNLYESNGKFTPMNNPMFMHEYGHYLQSQKMGIEYLVKVGIPSIFSAQNSELIHNRPNVSTHDVKWYERDANKLASYYFARDGVDWSENLEYPIDYPNFNGSYDYVYSPIYSSSGRMSSARIIKY